MPILRLVAIVLPVLSISVAGCSDSSVTFEGKASGRIESSGTTGDWVLDRGTCYSGEREGFFGVTVESPQLNGPSVMFVKNPVGGWVVKARIAGSCHGDTCTSMVYTKDECETLDVDLKLDPTRKSQFFNGSASIDCSVDGSRVSGTLTMEACHAPWGR
jgi:hypothetical protein